MHTFKTQPTRRPSPALALGSLATRVESLSVRLATAIASKSSSDWLVLRSAALRSRKWRTNGCTAPAPLRHVTPHHPAPCHTMPPCATSRHTTPHPIPPPHRPIPPYHPISSRRHAEVLRQSLSNFRLRMPVSMCSYYRSLTLESPTFSGEACRASIEYGEQR